MRRPVDYDRIAATYDRRYREEDYGAIGIALHEFVGVGSGLRVLEVGCGTGHWLACLLEWGCRAAGLDLSFEMIRQAAQRVPTVPLALGQAALLPWRSDTFDRVACINAFHHFPDKEGFLAEARRVLRSGGRLLSVGLDPHTGLDRWCVYDYFDNTYELDRGRYPPTAQIRTWMSELGFVDCDTFVAQHVQMRVPAREALEQGLLDQSQTSQLTIQSEEEYARGIARIRRAVKTAEKRGETFFLEADLRLYGTVGSVP